MITPVYITSIATISPLGKTSEEIWTQYKEPHHLLRKHDFEENQVYAGFLKESNKEELVTLRDCEARFKNLDQTVLYAIFAARQAYTLAGWDKKGAVGINIGSSRGATGLFEKYYNSYLTSGKAEILASPTTTLGNISSWVAQDLQSSGPDISHSVTCSSGLHAVLNGIAWLEAGWVQKFLVGGSEAALTPFTIAQMKAMKIYASGEQDFPCRALDMKKTRNSMVLGEGAGMLCLEKDPAQAIAKITGIGYATEQLKHSVSISANAQCLQRSMKMAIGDLPVSHIDAIVMHAPGTIKGDEAEVKAIKEVFNENLPALTTNKWKIGHTFGASGILSIELAILMLQHQEFIEVPFSEISKKPKRLSNILVNAVGFGGNAVSVLISKI